MIDRRLTRPIEKGMRNLEVEKALGLEPLQGLSRTTRELKYSEETNGWFENTG